MNNDSMLRSRPDENSLSHTFVAFLVLAAMATSIVVVAISIRCCRPDSSTSSETKEDPAEQRRKRNEFIDKNLPLGLFDEAVHAICNRHPYNFADIEPGDSTLSGDDEDHEEVAECAICLSSLLKGQSICTSNNGDCTHVFHASCASAWLLSDTTCPVCRETYLLETV